MKRFASNQIPNFLCAAACLAVLIAGCGNSGDPGTGTQQGKVVTGSSSRSGTTEASGSGTSGTSEASGSGTVDDTGLQPDDCAKVTEEPEPNEKGETCFRCLDANDNLLSRQCEDLRPTPPDPNAPGCANLQPVASDNGEDCWDCIAASGKSLGVECLPHRE